MLHNKQNSELQLRKAIDLVSMLFVFGLYLLNNHVLKEAFVGLPYFFFLGHFNDLICPFFILAFSDLLLSLVSHPINSLKGVYAIMLPAAFVWECVAPYINPNSVADPIDFACYLIGAFAFWAISQVPHKTRQSMRAPVND